MRWVLLLAALLTAAGPVAGAELAVENGKLSRVLTNVGPSPVTVTGARYNGDDHCRVAVFLSHENDLTTAHFNVPSYRMAQRLDSLELQPGMSISLGGKTACNSSSSPPVVSIVVDLLGEPPAEVHY